MTKILIDLLIWAAKTVGGKYLEHRLENHRPTKLVFTNAAGAYCYSHYEGQNHVREGGQTRIYQADARLTVFNPSTSDRVIRELTLFLNINDQEHHFHLFDLAHGNWQENYLLPAMSVSSFSWQAAPVGHGISAWLGAPGLIPFSFDDRIQIHLTYLDEKGQLCPIEMSSVTGHRLPKEQIAL